MRRTCSQPSAGHEPQPSLHGGGGTPAGEPPHPTPQPQPLSSAWCLPAAPFLLLPFTQLPRDPFTSLPAARRRPGPHSPQRRAENHLLNVQEPFCPRGGKETPPPGLRAGQMGPLLTASPMSSQRRRAHTSPYGGDRRAALAQQQGLGLSRVIQTYQGPQPRRTGWGQAGPGQASPATQPLDKGPSWASPPCLQGRADDGAQPLETG